MERADRFDGAMTTATACTWTDAERGFREEIAFVNDVMFTVTVAPLDQPRGLTLICPPLADDLVRNYRREVILARRLARRGIASQRFQYRSTGNSLGESDQMDWSQLVDDARTALRVASEKFDGLRRAVFGTRFGGMVAATIASETVGAPVALWDPVPTLNDFVRDVVRIERLVALSDRNPDAASQPSGRTALATRRLPTPLVDERDKHTISNVLVGPLGDVWVASIVEGLDARGTNKAVDALRALARSVERVSVPFEGSWWPVGPVRTRQEDDPWPLIDQTVEWLVDTLDTAPQ
jgi:alpha/beta superfamily hydrolase